MREIKCNKCGKVLHSSTEKCMCDTQKSTPQNNPTNFNKHLNSDEFDLRKGF